MPHELQNGRWIARFRSKGAGHYVQAAFILFWLCGWAVGELAAVGSLLAVGLTHLPPEWVPIPLPTRPEPAFTLAAGGLLGAWLTLWTLAGVMVMRDLLRIIGSCDEIQWDHTGLVVTRSLGPFRSRREIPAGQVLRFRELLHRPGLVVELPKEDVELTRRGTRTERQALKLALRSALPGRSPDASPTGLPDNWTAQIDTAGTHILSTTPRTWIATLGWWRSEIHVRSGSVTFVRRLGSREWRREVHVGIIRLGFDRDSDGDLRYTLMIHGDGRRHSVASSPDDHTDLLILGRWLEAHIQRPLELDRDIAA